MASQDKGVNHDTESKPQIDRNKSDEGEEFPEPSAPDSVHLEANQLLIPIEANLDLARAKFEAQLVKKTLTIPKYLNMVAEEYGINFSQTLTEALKEKLRV